MKRIAPLAAALVLAGCTTTVAGRGQGSGVPSTTGLSPTGSGSSHSGSGTSSAALPSIGDPNTADLCAGVQLPAYRAFGRAGFDPSQNPPSCYVTITRGSDIAAVGLSDVAMPPGQATPRAQGHDTVVAGLPVVEFTSDQTSCQRDIYAMNVVLSIRAIDLGANLGAAALCRAADQMVAQTAKTVVAGTLPRVKLATPSLVRLQMCRSIQPGDLRGISRGAPAVVAEHYFGTFCRGSNPEYVFGVEAVLRKAAARPLNTTTAGGHRFAWFDEIRPDSIACDLTSIQKPTSDPATVEAVDMYLLARDGPLRGQQLCKALTGLAVTALSRLGLR